MSNLDNLNRQHQEIAQVIKDIEAIINQKDIEQESFNLSFKIGLLAGKLLTHLSSEDKYLYPALVSHAHSKVQETAKRFKNEMGNLANDFTNYKKTYMIANNIKKNPSQFAKDTATVFNAIKKRVEAEEKNLYPLL
ncbi:hemerythrin domain-containing protein [Desulfofalx alkaliphila]|uniref:hemerythrin domain-containing protein n=1 Tax=Desulfofalx alkaliphila TaxID=105483 RepID=UPI0004E26E9D|nr:hemerythrin domain-containing protein [Desulfofalx alkaliphila]